MSKASRDKIAEELVTLYQHIGIPWEVPIIYASSVPVGAFLAPILAHTKRLNPTTIANAVDEAKRLAFAKKVSKALINKHRDALSSSKKGGGAYCYQPGGSVSSKILYRQRFKSRPISTSTTRILNERNRDLARLVLRAGALHVRRRIHAMFEQRVKYHAFLNVENLPTLGRHVVCWPNQRFVVVCKQPVRVLMNNNLRIHATEQAAIRYPDGWEVSAVAGIFINNRYIKHPELLTIQAIRDNRNVEVKRALIELMGYEKWLTATNAQLLDEDVDQDGRPRKLWQMSIDVTNTGLWNWRAVHATEVNLLDVFNSTPEPNGVHKKYFLQVPVDQNSINEALAWMLDERGINKYRNLQMRIET